MASNEKNTNLDETIIELVLNAFKSNTSTEEVANVKVSKILDEKASIGKGKYFIDDEGCYYYQPAGETQNVILLDGAEDTEEIRHNDPQLRVDGEAYQTVSLGPTETDTNDECYVLVVHENEQALDNTSINIDQHEEKNNEYTLNDKEEGQSSAIEAEKQLRRKSKKGKETKKHMQENVQTLDKIYMKVDQQEEGNNKYILNDKDEGQNSTIEIEKQPQSKTKNCHLCTYTTHRRYLLLRHMKSHSEERPHKCSICERGYKSLGSLQNHLNVHNGVRPFICKYCHCGFTTSGELVRHVRYKHTLEKPHKCGECDYATVELSKLRRHVRSHTGERPYQCPHCTYASLDTYKLKRHLRIHTGEKSYICEHCNMSFTQSNALKSHKLVHMTSEKPVYSCELCPATCSRKADLRLHIQKLHTSEKLLKCKRCGEILPDRYSCKMHNKTHVGEKSFRCDICSYAAKTHRYLKVHMLKHTGEKPFACHKCNQSFEEQQLLSRHEVLFHNPDYVAVHHPGLSQREKLLDFELSRHKLSEEDKTEDLDFNKEGKGGEEEDLKLQEQDGIVLQAENMVMVDETDDQQYLIFQLINLEDDNGKKLTSLQQNTRK